MCRNTEDSRLLANEYGVMFKLINVSLLTEKGKDIPVTGRGGP
jgi:hypothetical protein